MRMMMLTAVILLLAQEAASFSLTHSPHTSLRLSATPKTSYDPSHAFTTDSIADRTIRLLETSEDVAADSTTLNILKDIHGVPITAEYLSEKMQTPIHSFACRDAFHGFMSNACRITMKPNNISAFYKSIAFEELPHAWEKHHRAPFKLQRDIQSYHVVAQWLQSEACRRVTQDTAIVIPKCYDAQLKPNYQNPMESQFSFLLQDLPWPQVWLLNNHQTHLALDALAQLHAYFWAGSHFYDRTPAAQELEDAIWPSGSYVQPQAQDPQQWKLVASEWQTKRLKFRDALQDLSCWDNLGDRLQAVAENAGRHAHPFANELAADYQQFRTFTHGDPKAANLFFQADQVGLIDFQWSGFGLAATDLAHFLTSAVHADVLEHEDELLDYYYTQLRTNLVKFGAYPNLQAVQEQFPQSTLVQQYDTAVLDLCRLVIAYTWSRFDQAVDRNDAQACAGTMNKTSYNKALPNVVWLVTKCDQILTKRGV